MPVANPYFDPWQTPKIQVPKKKSTLPNLGGGPSSPDGQDTTGASTGSHVQTLDELLASSPLYAAYQQQLANLMAQSVADKASRDAALKRAVIAYGEAPDVATTASLLGLPAGDVGSIFDPLTRQMAEQNTASGLSTKARVQQAYNDTQKQTVDTLAARGALQSGDLGWYSNRNLTDYNRKQYDQLNQLLDYLNGVQQGYVTAERARQQQEWEAMMEALKAAAESGGTGGTGGTGGSGSDTTGTTTPYPGSENYAGVNDFAGDVVPWQQGVIRYDGRGGYQRWNGFAWVPTNRSWA
jgi:hypothetical protein